MIEGAVSVSTIIDRSQNVHITNFNRSKHPKYHYLNNSRPTAVENFLRKTRKTVLRSNPLHGKVMQRSVHNKFFQHQSLVSQDGSAITFCV